MYLFTQTIPKTPILKDLGIFWLPGNDFKKTSEKTKKAVLERRPFANLKLE
jgi:hypothetical protein